MKNEESNGRYAAVLTCKRSKGDFSDVQLLHQFAVQLPEQDKTTRLEAEGDICRELALNGAPSEMEIPQRRRVLAERNDKVKVKQMCR